LQGFHPTSALTDFLTKMPMAKPLLGLQALRNEGLATLKKIPSFLNADSPPAVGRCQRFNRNLIFQRRKTWKRQS